MDASPAPSSMQTRHCNEFANGDENGTVVFDSETNCSRPRELASKNSVIEKPIHECKQKTLIKRRASLELDASEATSSYASTSSPHKGKGKGKGKWVVCKRRNPRVQVRRSSNGDVSSIGFPLGMSFAAVLAQVSYRRDAAAERMSPSHLSLMCTSAIKESLANVYGDKLDGLIRNFEQSFSSTLSTLRLIYESCTSDDENNFCNSKMEIPTSKLILEKGDCSRAVVIEDGHSQAVSLPEIQDQSNRCEDVKDSISTDLDFRGQANQMVCFPPVSSGSLINNPRISTFEKSVVEQSRANDLKTLELGLTMKKLKFKEMQLALNLDLNELERSKLAIGISKASFKAEKFKNQLEELRHGELNKKCIDCLITGLLVMSSSLFYGAYVYSYERISEATASCTPSTEESSSWWTPKSVITFNSRLHVLWCQVQVMSRMVFGVLMIFAIAYLLLQRSTTSSSQTMPVTFIILLLGVACGSCGKLCVDTLGGSGYMWLLYWEILCLLHFLCIVCTSTVYQILHGPVTAPRTTERNTIFPYWIRRFMFYATLLMILPLFCGLNPFASPGQWKDHFLSKVSAADGSEW